MSESEVLSLVARYPHPAALARRLTDPFAYVVLDRLEADGLVSERSGLVRLTRRGRDELAWLRGLAVLVVGGSS